MGSSGSVLDDLVGLSAVAGVGSIADWNNFTSSWGGVSVMLVLLKGDSVGGCDSKGNNGESKFHFVFMIKL